MRTWIVRMTFVAALVLASAAQASAQANGEVTGTVVDSATGQPLNGAQVLIRGTKLGTAANDAGRFTISNVPAGQAVVRVQRIGYAPGERTITMTPGGQVTVNFSLQAQAVVLKEVVAVGYGTQRREEITSAVSSVTSDEFTEAPARDAASLIAGKMPGLAVATPTGDPTEGTEIMLRGVTTLDGPTDPLVLVDGVPGDLNTVAPRDIASISVLKDASAAAIYGSRASNGVILVTTKKASGGAPTIRYDGYASLSTIKKRPDFLTAQDYRDLIASGFEFPHDKSITDYGTTTDWQDLILRSPISQRHNISVTGGSENTNYTASFNYQNAQGIFIRSNNKTINGRIGLDQTMYDGKLQARFDLLTRVDNDFTGPDYRYAWREAIIRNPTDSVRDANGDWMDRGGYNYYNPLNVINEENGHEETRDLRMHGTVTLRPIESLSLQALAGTERSEWLYGSATTFKHFNGLAGTASRSTNSEIDHILELTGTLNKQLGSSHMTLLGGYSYQDFQNEGFNASNTDFPTDLFGYNSLESGSYLTSGRARMGSGQESHKLIGFFSRLNYDWDNRYLLMASLRYEGDSRFGANHKWGYFPAISAGWQIANESFMDGVTWINELKLRAGYGVTGIAPRDPYQSLTSYAYGAKFLFNGDWYQGLRPSRNPNPDLKWERKGEIDIGTDFAMFDSRLSGSLDLYRRETKDMLYNYDVPVPPYLFGSILANVGEMRNEGVEASLSYDVIRSPDLQWTTSANWSTNRNKLVSLSNAVYRTDDSFYPGYTGEPVQTSTHRVDVGGPIGNFYGWESVDIGDDGAWIVLDSLGNRISIADAKEKDKRVLGNGLPKHYVAWNNSVRYKGLDFTVNMRGAFGFQILNFQRMFYENPGVTQYNMLRSALDKPYGKTLLVYPLAYVSYYVENGDYWKVDNVTLGYTLSPRLLGPISGVVKSARFYVSGSNLLTLTGYKGMDPEVSLFGLDGLSPGNDQRDTYPTTRMFTIGANLSF
ncbi:MAG TPA: SusC/RagA family TonB-linked outer membrane protein [Gemmatimonadaceae bacterium]|nr:SusC/RagA family TonB-linked outer membrane protein [Gemmatimonadaceae bacterium]